MRKQCIAMTADLAQEASFHARCGSDARPGSILCYFHDQALREICLGEILHGPAVAEELNPFKNLAKEKKRVASSRKRSKK